MSFLSIAVLIYGLLLAVLYLMQRSLIYLPDADRPVLADYNRSDVSVIIAQTEDGLTLEGWFRAPQHSKPVIIWFHGNAQHHGARLPLVEPYLNAGYGVLLAGYRGYGGNPGKPTEQGLYKDGRAWINGLQRSGIKLQDIILYGESLGSGVAVQLATEFPGIKALVLQAPYSSLPDVAQTHYFYMPVQLLMKDRFNNLNKISQIKAPVLIMQGLKDRVIPPGLGQRLYEAAPEPKKLIQFEGAGHNDLLINPMAQTVEEFLAHPTKE